MISRLIRLFGVVCTDSGALYERGVRRCLVKKQMRWNYASSGTMRPGVGTMRPGGGTMRPGVGTMRPVEQNVQIVGLTQVDNILTRSAKITESPCSTSVSP